MRRNHRNKAAIKEWLKMLEWSNTATIRNSHIMNHVQMNRYVSILMREHKGIERVFWCLEKDKSQLESHAHLLVKTKGKIDSIPRKNPDTGYRKPFEVQYWANIDSKNGIIDYIVEHLGIADQWDIII